MGYTRKHNSQMIIDLSICFECGAPKKDMHHVIPKSKGGTKTIPLCAKCHGLIHDRNFVKHRQLQKEGIERAKLLGKLKYNGRKKGTIISDEKILQNHKDIVQLLEQELSVREISSITKKSTATIVKVNKIIKKTI